MTSIAIHPRHLLAALHCAGKSDVRYYLNGVYVEATTKETRLVATTGVVCAAFRHAASNTEAVDLIIPRATVEAFAKVAKNAKDAKDVALRIADGQHRLHWDGGSLPFDPIDGLFPNYRRVFPQSPSGETAQFNPELLCAFSKVAKTLGVRECPEILHNGGSGALVRLNGRSDFAGVVMPWRQPAESLAVPDTSWVAL